MDHAKRTSLKGWMLWPLFLCLLCGAGLKLLQLNQPLFILLNRFAAQIPGSIWAHVTMFGDSLVAAVFAIPFVKRRPAAVWALVLASIFAGIGVNTIKPLFHLPRPPRVLGTAAIHIIGPALKSRAFPSGHTATAAVAASVCVFTFRNIAVRAGAVLAMLMVGFSRIAVGVHWPLDICGGIGVGWMAGVAGHLSAPCFSWGYTRCRPFIGGALLCIGALYLGIWYHIPYPQVIFAQRIIAFGFLFWGIFDALETIMTMHSQPVRKLNDTVTPL